ncbi:MAG: class I adenylate-forming enzyme family protein [Alphaproteobacteria bacterium]
MSPDSGLGRPFQHYESEKLMRRVEQEALPRNVGTLLGEAAARHGEKPLLVFFDDRATYSYREIDRDATRLAHGMSKLGVEHGSHVGIMVYTQQHYPITWMANARLGAVTVPINYNYTPRELLYMLEDSEADYLVIHKELLPIFEGMERQPVPRERVIVVNGASGYPVRWEDVLESGSDGFTPPVEPGQLDLMNIQYTSGTTGMPKGAMHTQRYWLTFGKVGAAQFQNRIKNQLIAQPFYYVDAQWLFLMTIYQGATAYVAKKQSASRFFGWVKDFKINYCNFPEVVSKQPERPDDADNDLIVISCYSHRLENYRWYEKRYGCLARQGFSMTELGCALYVPMEADAMTGTGTVGTPVAFREAMVADPEGHEVKRGELGELCVRGHGILLGYYKKPEASAKAFHPGGWFRTGDLARHDPDGWFYYLGRMKDMVKRSGENVSATEVEGVLRGVEDVLEAAVLPVPDDLRGEEVKAYLLLSPDKTAKDVPPEVVIAHCEKNLARFKIPRYLEYVTEFPRTPSLKIKKSALIAAKLDLRVGSYDRVDKIWR